MHSRHWISENVEEDARYVVCKLLILARAERVWSVLTDYERVPEVFSNLTKLKIVNDNGPIKVMEQQVKPLPPVPLISYVVEVKETCPTLLEWRGLTPYIKVNQGCFSLHPVNQGEHTLVTFAAWAEAAFLISSSIIRSHMQAIMPKVLLTLKEHAEIYRNGPFSTTEDSLCRLDSRS
jgi:hypothetical protein